MMWLRSNNHRVPFEKGAKKVAVGVKRLQWQQVLERFCMKMKTE